MDDEGREFPAKGGVTRRDLVKRGAVVGGALLWATPIVQTLGPAAHAQAATRCGCCYCWDGDRNDPINDLCNDNGQSGSRANAAACATFCSNEGFDNSEYCTEFAGGCTCRQNTDPGVGPGESGCACA